VREQNALNARQPANAHRRVLCGRSLFSILVLGRLNKCKFTRNAMFIVLVEIHFSQKNEQSQTKAQSCDIFS